MNNAACPDIEALVQVVQAAILRRSDNKLPDIGTLHSNHFQRLAMWHKVEPLVARFLCGRLPPPQRGDWAMRLMRAAAAAEQILVWQRELCEALENRQIPVLPLRGLLLARALHGEIHLRSMADIDLLVPPECAALAMDVLSGMGLTPPRPLNSTQRAACARFRTECAFLDSRRACAVDLHWHAMPAWVELLEDAALWRGAGRTELGGYVFREAKPSHQLLLLCSHGNKHGWDRLGYLADFATALCRYPETEIHEAQRLAEKSGRTILWHLALALTKDMFGNGPWCDLIGKNERSDSRHVVLAIRQHLYSSEVIGGRGGLERKGLAAICPQWRDRFCYWREIIFTPSILELSAVTLPRQLWGGYWLIRLLRLAVRGLTGWTGGN